MDTTTLFRIKDFISTLSEEESLHAYHTMAAQFGWVGTFFTRADAEQEWVTQMREGIGNDDFDEPLDDETWEDIRSNWHWRKGMTDRLTEYGWEFVYKAVSGSIHTALYSQYEVMADPAPHTCYNHPDYDGTVMDGCAGCDQAATHPCKWCGYGAVFTTHAPEAHAENGDPNVTDINALGDDWCDAPHIYKTPKVSE